MKILKFFLYTLGLTVLPISASAVTDDIYYSTADAKKDAEEAVNRANARAEARAKAKAEKEAKMKAEKEKSYQAMVIKSKQQQEVRVSNDTIYVEDPTIVGNDFYTDTILVERGDDYTYTDRLNRFHDAGIPMYESDDAAVESVSTPSSTNIYLIGSSFDYDPWGWSYYHTYYPYYSHRFYHWPYSDYYWNHGYYGLYYGWGCHPYYAHNHHHYHHAHSYHPVHHFDNRRHLSTPRHIMTGNEVRNSGTRIVRNQPAQLAAVLLSAAETVLVVQEWSLLPDKEVLAQ